MKKIYDCALILASLLATVSAEAIERLSVNQNGIEANVGATARDVSSDGRFVVFSSGSSNLVGDDTNGQSDIFVLDRNDGSIERVSVDSDENQIVAPYFAVSASISNDGRYICFRSNSPSLVPGDTNGGSDLFVRDRVAGTTERVSLSDTGEQLSGNSHGEISGNGLYLVFEYSGSEVMMTDTNGVSDIFRRTLSDGTTIRVSVSNEEMEATAGSTGPSISDDGNRIGFTSAADNLIGDDDNSGDDYFVRDISEETTIRVSVAHDGSEQNGSVFQGGGVLSGDGNFIAFSSTATNLVPGDTNGMEDVFVRDLVNETTELVSVATNSSTFITDDGSRRPTISPDGRYVGFETSSTQIDSRVNQGIQSHSFVRDRETSTTSTVQISTTGQFGTRSGGTDALSFQPYFAADGRYIFTSDSDNLVQNDTNSQWDVFGATFGEAPVVSPPPAVAPDNSALCTSLKNKLKKLKKKAKKLKSSGKAAAAKKLKKKMKKIKKQLKALGC